MRAHRLRSLQFAVLASLLAVLVTDARQARGAAAQADLNGFKVGDVVEVDTAFGWADATIVAMRGDNYQVSVQGVVVMKTYPLELHRKGKYTDRDHAVGLYALKDIVQVNLQGKGWTEGTVTTTRGMEYNVTFPDNRTVWASGENIRYVRTPGAAPSTAGVAPKGFVSCAGKIEGRYATTGGFGSMTIVFKAGKATMTAGLGDEEVLECWTAKDKIILRKPGAPGQDMPIDINTDGSLQTPLGELKKKGPAKVIGTMPNVISGRPDPSHISTSFVERLNWTTRTTMRRYTRLSNGFSRKIENHMAAVSLNYFAYNFCKIHRTLRVTPAMAAGVVTRLMDLSELVAMLEESESTKAA